MNLTGKIAGIFGAVGALAVMAAAAAGSLSPIGALTGVIPEWLLMPVIGGSLAAVFGLGAGTMLRVQWRRLELCLRTDCPEQTPINELCVPLRRLATLHCDTVTDLASRLNSAHAKMRQMEMQHHISENEVRQLEDVLHSLRDAVIVTNSFNELVMANDAAAGLFGFSREEAMSKQVADVVSEKDLLALIAEASQSSNTATRRNGELALERDSQALSLEVALSSVTDAGHDSSHVVTILHDVTQERQVSKMKNEFVSKASHELRTPLSSIKAYVEMLIDGEAHDEEARAEFYGIIQHEAERLGRMIDDMLNISRIEAGMIAAEWDKVDFVDIARQSIELLQPQAEAKKIKLSLATPLQGCIAEADADMIKQVITNLISNSIKYTPDGGRVTVAPDLTDCNRSVIVSVTDTGLGIPAEALPKLFGKFFRVEAHERFAKGTGLGLNLVKQIVESVHKGEVGVESEAGRGSRFWFIIPCRQGG